MLLVLCREPQALMILRPGCSQLFTARLPACYCNLQHTHTRNPVAWLQMIIYGGEARVFHAWREFAHTQALRHVMFEQKQRAQQVGARYNRRTLHR